MRPVEWTGFALALVGLLCLGGCTGQAAGGPEASRADLRVTRGSVAPMVLLTGELAAEDSIPLVVPNVNIWPVTLRWIAEEGDEVAPGDPVVEFDNSQLSANLETLRSQVVTAANTLSQTRAKASNDRAQAFFGLEQRKADWLKAELAAGMPRDLTSEQEWGRLQLELKKAALEREKAEAAMAATEAASKAAIAIDRLALQKAKTVLARAERGLEALMVTAPRAGLVLVAENPREGRPFHAGDTSWPGLTVASLPDLSSLYVEASLFDVDDARIEAGALVVANLDAFPDEILLGSVRRVAGFAQEEGRRSSRRSFRVLVDLEGLDPARMRPGMSVKLEVMPPPEDGLVAPRAALSFGDQETELRLADGSRQRVEVGACDLQVCLVTGVEEGVRLAPMKAEVTR